MTIFTKTPPTFNYHHNFITSLRKTSRFSSRLLCTFKESSVHVFRKSVRFKEMNAAVSMETRFISSGQDEEHTTVSGFQQDALINNDDVVSVSHHQNTQTSTYGLNTVVNRLSKWFVAVTFGGFIILRHDGLALWAATGSVCNFILSIALKRILKQERPFCEVSSGPGMPSSHAQSIFFSLVFFVMSMIERMGLNGVTTSLGILLVALGSYFSWLRVLLGFHTTSQVIAGMIVGSNFAVLWFWAWEAFISEAYNNSNPLVQILLSVGGVCYFFGFISYVLLHLTKD